MKQVIRIPDNNEKQEKVLKPIEFTYIHGLKGWVESNRIKPNMFQKIVYLGKCLDDGDMFAGYENDCIEILKGHLNDGVY